MLLKNLKRLAKGLRLSHRSYSCLYSRDAERDCLKTLDRSKLNPTSWQRGKKLYHRDRPRLHTAQRRDLLAKHCQLAQLVLHGPQEDSLGSCRLVGRKLLRTLFDGTDQQAPTQFSFLAAQRRAQYVLDDPLCCGAIFGNVEEHRRYGVGEPVRVLAEEAKMFCESFPSSRECFWGGVVGGGQPTIAQAGCPPNTSFRSTVAAMAVVWGRALTSHPPSSRTGPETAPHPCATERAGYARPQPSAASAPQRGFRLQRSPGRRSRGPPQR